MEADKIVTRRRSTVLNIVIWGLLGAFPLFMGSYYVGQMAQFFVYGIFAMSLALIWGGAGLLCFGQAVFFGMGGYAMALVTKQMIPALEGFPSSYTGLLLAMAAPALFANVLGRFLFYGCGLTGAHLAIVTLSVSVVVERLATNLDYIGGNNGLSNIPVIDLGIARTRFELLQPIMSYYFAFVVGIVTYLGLSILISSPYGTVLRAVRDNEERTTFFGYATGSYKLSVFTVAAAVAGLAGGMFVAQFGFASPTLLGPALSTEVLIWVALGGRAVLLAAFLGAIIVRGVESVLSETLGYYWLLALGLIFVLNVLFLPSGLLGALLAPQRRGIGTQPEPRRTMRHQEVEH